MTFVSKDEINGFTVEIHYDEDCSSPRDTDISAAGLVLSLRSYDLPNDADIDFGAYGGWDEIAARLKEDGAYLVLPVWGYIHSGIALKVGDRTWPFDDQWDSGLAGLAYVGPKHWKDCQGTEWTGSEEQLAQAEAMIKADVGEYGQYLNGECFGYRVLDTDGEEVDSCWGFIGIEYAEECAKEAAEAAEHEVKCNGQLDRRTGLITHDGPCPLTHPADQLVTAARSALDPLYLLGNYIGNEFGGTVGIPAFDRCATILAIKDAIKAVTGEET